MFLADGCSGDLERIQWPMHGGGLALCGCEVLQSFVGAAAPWGGDAGREVILKQWRERLCKIENDTPMSFHRLDDYDENHRLKPGIDPATPARD